VLKNVHIEGVCGLRGRAISKSVHTEGVCNPKGCVTFEGV